LAYAQAHGGTFTSREYQRLVGLDLYGASNSIKVLIRKGVVRSTAKGSRVYEILVSGAQLPIPPDELQQLLPLLRASGSVRNSDVREVLGLSYKSASRLLDRLVSDGWLERTGDRRGTRYITSERHYGTVSL
jgi:ATP-dependent DNA helicase RecG